MTDERLRIRFEKIVADLCVEGEPVALDKVVKRHRHVLQQARDMGLSWASILRLLTKAAAPSGWPGKPISADHLRASFSRSSRVAQGPPAPEPARSPQGPGRATENSVKPALSPAAVRLDPGRPQQGSRSPSHRAKAKHPAPAGSSSDLSEQDLETIRRRLG